jgi:hypothetical protein
MGVSIPRYDRVIGLPEDGHAIAISNSERDDLACPHRWWFRHVERLKSPDTGPKRFGTLWHLWMEELHRWWMATDTPWPTDGATVCPFCRGSGRSESSPVGVLVELLPPELCARCGGTGHGVVVRIGHQLADTVQRSARAEGSTFTSDDAQQLIEHLSRTIQGWILRYGPDPYSSLRVVGVEVGLARPILNPRTRTPYTPETLMARLADGKLRFAETGEAQEGLALPEGVREIVSVRWPWYQIGRLDCILKHRTKATLFVGEFKTSSDPRGLVADLSLDPQTAGYAWLLDAHRDWFGGESVVGAMFDVAASIFHADPERLKGRPTKAVPDPPAELSQARNRTTPSWRYRAALTAHGVDPAPYQEHIAFLTAQIDPKLYLREWPSLGEEERRRYAEEVYAVAVRLANLRRAVARAEDVTDLTVAVPRVPICRLPGGGCVYRALCLLDGEQARQRFEIGPTATWVERRT